MIQIGGSRKASTDFGLRGTVKSYVVSGLRLVAEDSSVTTTIPEKRVYWYSGELHYFARIDDRVFVADTLASSTVSMLPSVK